MAQFYKSSNLVLTSILFYFKGLVVFVTTKNVKCADHKEKVVNLQCLWSKYKSPIAQEAASHSIVITTLVSCLIKI